MDDKVMEWRSSDNISRLCDLRPESRSAVAASGDEAFLELPLLSPLSDSG